MSILVFIPMYNCAAQIPRVLAQLTDPRTAAVVDAVVCIDNRSTDGTLEAAAAALEMLPLARRTLLRNDENYGLGGSHKVAIEFARREGHDFLVVLHGDDQGTFSDILPHLQQGVHTETDFLMGSRFMKGSRLQGYSALRTAANRTFNWIFSAVVGRRLCDLGSGLNLFRLRTFEDDFHTRFADNLTFNYYLIIAVADLGFRLRFFPVTWREEDQVSNAKLGRMGLHMLGLLMWRIVNKRSFLSSEHRAKPRATYPTTVVGCWDRKANLD